MKQEATNELYNDKLDRVNRGLTKLYSTVRKNLSKATSGSLNITSKVEFSLARREFQSVCQKLLKKQYTILYRKISFSLFDIISMGFNIRIESDGFVIEAEPYTDDINIHLISLSEVEMLNFLDIFKLIYKFGGILYSTQHAIPTHANVPVICVDLQKRVIIPDGGGQMYLDSIDPWTFAETFVMRIHDNWNLDAKTILDIGAEAGDTALFFASKKAIVYAVEPVHYDKLVKNLQMCSNYEIKSARLALGTGGILRFGFDNYIVDGSASAFNKRKYESYVEAKALPLREILSYFGLAHIDYVKADCKGGEFSITESDLKLVKLGITIEYTAENSDQLNKLTETILRSGFNFRIFNHNPLNSTGIKYHGTIIAWK